MSSKSGTILFAILCILSNFNSFHITSVYSSFGLIIVVIIFSSYIHLESEQLFVYSLASYIRYEIFDLMKYICFSGDKLSHIFL